jgi:hypothetical protein
LSSVTRIKILISIYLHWENWLYIYIYTVWNFLFRSNIDFCRQKVGATSGIAWYIKVGVYKLLQYLFIYFFHLAVQWKSNLIKECPTRTWRKKNIEIEVDGAANSFEETPKCKNKWLMTWEIFMSSYFDCKFFGGPDCDILSHTLIIIPPIRYPNRIK